MPFVPHAKCPSRQVSQVPLVAAAICRKRHLASGRVANADWASATSIAPHSDVANQKDQKKLRTVKKSKNKSHEEFVKDTVPWNTLFFYI